ncbi:MAG: PTS mannose/fructose/sorbose transporter family subunit IID [Calditrichaeota bacterium]|nr:PTS mannose/fructose/sorbose transporter family subunit IID [Calditrichota bacterium]
MARPDSVKEGETLAPRKIRKWDLFRVFLRSFFVQSVWNYRSLISIGFGICLFPILKRLYPDTRSRKEFLLRHLKFFNAHPYMVSYALGVSIRLEEEYASGNLQNTDRLDRMKDLLISILGSLGDQIFWLTLRPVSLLVGAFGVFVASTVEQRVAVLILTFLLYNIPHLYLRYVGILEGYRYGMEIYRCFREGRFEKLKKGYLYLGVAIFFLFLGVLLVKFKVEQFAWIPVIGGAAIYASIFYKFSKNFYFTCLFTILFFVIVGFIFL